MSIRCIPAAIALSVLGASAAAQPPAQVVAYDYRAMYEALTPSIAKIVTDTGHGSGFLLSEEGFIATNHHVVRNSRYLAAEFVDRGRFAVDVVLLDPRNDVAVLKVNPAVVRGLQPLPLLPEIKERTIVPGIPAVAFGSPLSQSFLMTQGVVSKVEDRALLGDFLVLPSNSGGPLVNMDGEVIGINTVGGHGSGRAVPAAVLRRIFDVRFAHYDAPDPPAAPLPMLSADRFPAEVLKAKIMETAVDDDAYELDADKFTIQAITPVRLGRLHIREDLIHTRSRMNRRGNKMDDPDVGIVDAPFYEWTRNAHAWLDYAVTFEIKPEFDSAAGSVWQSMAIASSTGFAAGYSGTPQTFPRPHQEIEFKAEFQDFRVYRDGELLEPITPGRSITESAFQNYDMTFIDEAYSGMYVYAPEAFMEGERFRFEVYDARESGRIHRSIELQADAPLIRQLRLDFEGATAPSSQNFPAEKGEDAVVTVSLPIKPPRHTESEGAVVVPVPTEAAAIDTEKTTWRVEHVHRFFGGGHPGDLILTADGLQFSADNEEHSFVTEWSQVTEITPWLTLGASAMGIELANGEAFQFRMESEGMLDDFLMRAERSITRTR